MRLWAETPPEGLEDEQAEENRRLQKARAAADCRPFLERFFKPGMACQRDARPSEFANSVREFARGIGLLSQAELHEADAAAIRTLLSLLESEGGESMSWTAFRATITVLALTECLSPGNSTAGRIRVVAPDDARHLACDYLFILGLGENSFPKLGPAPSLLDDADRIALREAGLALADPAARLGDEQLLFLQLIGRPRRGLVLSHAATDKKGQPLLPGSFLRSVADCFAPDTLKPLHQRMLIEGYKSQLALSPAEARVQFAARMHASEPAGNWQCPGLPPELCEQLRSASEVATARFRSREYGPFDGSLETSPAAAEVQRRFGPDKAFSPTASKPMSRVHSASSWSTSFAWKNWRSRATRWNSRAEGPRTIATLSRLHTKLNADPDLTRSRLPERLNAELRTEIDVAVHEYAERASSPAAKKLWELEGKRLHRSAAKYRDHWDAFIDPWRKQQAFLSPRLLEADFGFSASGQQVQSATAAPPDPLIIQVGGIEVRVGGRIDRVDVAELRGELGFWIIDYKTGRSANYTGKSIKRLEKLQLSLYALAVEKVFFPGRVARPLGLAYWLVTDDGPKPVLPDKRSVISWLSDPEEMGYVPRTTRGMGRKDRRAVSARVDFPSRHVPTIAPTHAISAKYVELARVEMWVRRWELSLPGDDGD